MKRKVIVSNDTCNSTGKVKKVRVRRRKTSSNPLKPKTHIAVEKGFTEVLDANDKALELTYTR